MPEEPEQLQDLLASARLFVTEAIETSPEVLPGALLLSAALARQTTGQLGVICPSDLKALFLESLPGPVRESFQDTGTTTVEVGGQPIELRALSSDHLPRSTEVVLSLGAGEEHLQALSVRPPTEGLTFIVPRTNSELAAFEECFPGAGRVRQRVEQRETGLSQSQSTRIRWFEERYEPVAQGHLNPNTEVVRLGEGQPQECRYCGKASPHVSFKNVSHAFPEQIGNKSLIDLRECDSCNKRFARRIDDDFGKWSHAIRALLRIRGKDDKVPKFGSLSDGVESTFENGRLTIRMRKDDERVTFDEENKRIRFELGLQSYVPMAVFKCFVKMALSVMPEPEAGECAHLKKWVLEKKHTYESFPFRPLMLYTQSIGGPLPNDRLSYILFRRKPAATECPYLMFVVSFANFVHQIPLPMPAQDHMLGSGQVTMALSYFTHPWDDPKYEAKYGAAKRLQEDLSSAELLKGEVSRMNFSFEAMVDYTAEAQAGQNAKNQGGVGGD